MQALCYHDGPYTAIPLSLKANDQLSKITLFKLFCQKN